MMMMTPQHPQQPPPGPHVQTAFSGLDLGGNLDAEALLGLFVRVGRDVEVVRFQWCSPFELRKPSRSTGLPVPRSSTRWCTRRATSVAHVSRLREWALGKERP